MFENPRYMTRGIQENVSLDLQIILWRLIDDRKVKGHKLDYLQVFELSSETVGEQTLQIVLHRQEQPQYRSTHRFVPIQHPLEKIRIWVVDDGEHSTMLFPSEY